MKAKGTQQTERLGLAIAMHAFETLGFAFREQSVADFGIDAHAELIDNEKVTGRLLGIQLKSGSSYFAESDGHGITFRASKDHVEYWLHHALPVVVCLCDTDTQEIYWQAVTPESVVGTGKGFKLAVPFSQKLNGHARPALRALLTPVVPQERYTEFELQDMSHAGAKRYSISIVMNGPATKPEIAAVIRQITRAHTKRRYHRSQLLEKRWGDADAHVLWTYVYMSAEDHARKNQICRSMWVDERLNPTCRPLAWKGENVGDDTIVVWNEWYESMSKHNASHTLSKEEYLRHVLPYFDEMNSATEVLLRSFRALLNKEITETRFLSTSAALLVRLGEIHDQIGAMRLAPFECRDVDGKLECVAAYLDNVRLYYSGQQLGKGSPETRATEASQQCTYAAEALVHLRYELSKVR